MIGVNEYFGWFDTDGATADRDALAPFMRSVRSCYPYSAIFVTEFGFGGNRSGPVEVRGTYQFQINSLQFHVGVFNNLPWLSGAMYFPVQDFAARPDFSVGTARPPAVGRQGHGRPVGHKKPAFAVMASLYKSFTQIGPRTLTGCRAVDADHHAQRLGSCGLDEASALLDRLGTWLAGPSVGPASFKGLWLDWRPHGHHQQLSPRLASLPDSAVPRPVTTTYGDHSDMKIYA